jgi:hypothetical protein
MERGEPSAGPGWEEAPRGEREREGESVAGRGDYAPREPGAESDEAPLEERRPRDPSAIRAEDTEPYIALQYVARLFKVAALVVIFALTVEVVLGIVLEGAGALMPLLGEVIRGIVLAALLWGAGDLTLLLIDVGHDVRAQRVLLGRLSARAGAEMPVRHDDRDE